MNKDGRAGFMASAPLTGVWRRAHFCSFEVFLRADIIDTARADVRRIALVTPKIKALLTKYLTKTFGGGRW